MRYIFKTVKEMVFLAKEYVLICIAISIGIPIYIGYVAKDIGLISLASSLSMIIVPYYVFFLFFGKIDLIEDKCKQMTYALLTPINRIHYVVAKYFLIVFCFILSVAGYHIGMVFMRELLFLSFSDIAYGILIYSVLTGIYVPLELKFGFENMKFYPMGMMLVVTFGGTIVSKYITKIMSDELSKILENFSRVTIPIALGLLVLSYVISHKIYEKKDL